MPSDWGRDAERGFLDELGRAGIGGLVRGELCRDALRR